MSSKMFKQAHKPYVRFRVLSSSASQWFVVRYFIVYWWFKLITDVRRKSFMPREHPTLSPGFAELTIYRYPLPTRLLMCRRIFRSQFLVGLLGLCRQTPPVSPMAQLKVLNDLAKKKATEKRQWTRIVMYRWKLHRMRINIVVLEEIWKYSDKDNLQRLSVLPGYIYLLGSGIPAIAKSPLGK